MKIQSGCIIWFGNTIIYWLILLLTSIHVISGFCHIGKFSMWKLLLSPSQLLCDKNWRLAVFGLSGDAIPVAELVRPWFKSWAYHPSAVWPWTNHLIFLSLSFLKNGRNNALSRNSQEDQWNTVCRGLSPAPGMEQCPAKMPSNYSQAVSSLREKPCCSSLAENKDSISISCSMRLENLLSVLGDICLFLISLL